MAMSGATHTVPPAMKTTATAISAKTCGRTPAFTTAVGVGCAGFWRRTTVGPSCSTIAVMRSNSSKQLGFRYSAGVDKQGSHPNLATIAQ